MPMPEQLILDLPVRAALGRDDFFVSGANSAAVASVENWAGWQAGKLVLCGPPGSGKTHLVHVWAQMSGAQIICARGLSRQAVPGLLSQTSRIAVEDVQAIAGNPEAEQALFHLHNLALAADGRLLLSGVAPPADWRLSLPDLKSRVQASELARLSPPDDALLCAILLKLFADRQLSVPANLVTYLAPRIERSFQGAGQVVTALDGASLAQHRPITRALAARVLEKLDGGTP